MFFGLEHLDDFSHHIGNGMSSSQRTFTHSIIFQRGRAQSHQPALNHPAKAMNHPVTMGPTFNRPVVDASSHQAAQAYVVAGDYKKAARLYEEAQHVREAVENFLQAEPWNPWKGMGSG